MTHAAVARGSDGTLTFSPRFAVSDIFRKTNSPGRIPTDVSFGLTSVTPLGRTTRIEVDDLPSTCSSRLRLIVRCAPAIDVHDKPMAMTNTRTLPDPFIPFLAPPCVLQASSPSSERLGHPRASYKGD